MAHKESNFFHNFLLGGISAAIGKTATAPLERIKLIIQNQEIMNTLPVKYSSPTDCLIKLIQHEGFLSLWRGNVVSIIRYFPTQAFNFAFKDTFKNIFKYNPDKNFWKFIMGNFISGGVAGGISMAILYPFDFFRTRLAVDNKSKEGQRQFSNTFSCSMKIIKQEGITGIYRGFSLGVLEMFVYRGIYFGGYDSLKEFYISKNSSFWFRWFLAQLATLISNMVVYPIDTVKRRFMMQSGEKEKVYNTVSESIIKIYCHEGFCGFYKGFGTNVVRIAGNSIVLVLYDEFQKRFIF